MHAKRAKDDLKALRHTNFMYNKDEELRRSTGSIYGGDSPTKSKPGMHVRSNSDTSEINFSMKRDNYDNTVMEPRSPTGESFFAIVQKFELNIRNERNFTIVSNSKKSLQGSTFIDGLREQHGHNSVSASPTIEKKIPILRRKNSLRSNTTSFFRTKKNDYREGEFDSGEKTPTRKAFAHYDCQSLIVNFEEQMQLRARYGDGLRRKNTRSGASAASTIITAATIADKQQGSDSSLDKLDDVPDYGDNKSNELVQNCPYFRNELGGEDDLDPQISLTRDNPAFQNPYDPSKPKEGKINAGKRRSTLDILLTAYDSARQGNLRSGTGVTILDNSKPDSGSLYLGERADTCDEEGKIVYEHADHGAYYYRNFFVGQEHLTYLGNDEKLGPVNISMKREKLDENTSLIRNDTDGTGTQYQYRIIIRTSELTTLRGNILEEAIPSTSRHGTARALPAKEILEHVAPELQLSQLRLGQPGIKVPEQLMKLDEQGMTNQYKAGILYCKAGQSTEEEMYNNQVAGPEFEEFLELIGKRVRLKGFEGYKAQLDNRNDSTGEYSQYTKFHNREVMFHVSTMLPWTPNNKQQLLRKRHIGNDIVTIVFQEPGALPFTPKNIRSHFQHVFIVIRVFNPCSESTYYRVAVSRSKDVPPFGPPIPAGAKFGKQKAFASFLLTKVINAENAAHKSEKFSAMATRTRHEYLKDLAQNYITATSLDSGAKSFGKFSLSGKKKEKVRPPICPERVSRGGLVWNVQVEDYRNSTMIECVMAISADTLVLVDLSSKETLFSVPCKAIIGWTPLSASIKVFYGSGECLVLNIPTYDSDDLPEIVRRVEAVTIGCQTQTLTLRRNMHGQLGFHVQYEGLVADVETGGYAWQAGLRQGCRLVEINGLIVATVTHEQMIEILRKPGSVTVVIVSPLPSGKPRRGMQPSKHQYWWSARSSTATISSYGGSASSVGEEHESRDLINTIHKNPPKTAPKTFTNKDASSTEKTVEEVESSGSSFPVPGHKHTNSGSTSSATGSSSTLNEDARSHAPHYGAAYTVATITPAQGAPDSDPRTPGNYQGHNAASHPGSSSSYESLTHSRPKWSGISSVEVENTAAPNSVGVTLKAPTAKGTLYVIASGPQSPTLIPSPRTPETPIFGSVSQRPDRQRRAVVNEHGENAVSDGEVREPSGEYPTRNGENGRVATHEFVYDNVNAKESQAEGKEETGKEGERRVPFKETSLGAVVTTTNTYKHNYDELTEASMTETVDKIEKAFGFRTPKLIDAPRKNYDYGQFERSASFKRNERRSPKSSSEDLKLKQMSCSGESLNRANAVDDSQTTPSEGQQSNPHRQIPADATKYPSEKDITRLQEDDEGAGHSSGIVVHHEVKREIARTLSAEELEVQLILEELQKAERDLGGTEGRIQTVVEVSRSKGEVIRESSKKPKEFDQRLAARNSIMERLESQRHAIGSDGVEGIKIYHAKSRSTPADVSKAQGYPNDNTSRQKHAASQDDITTRIRQDRDARNDSPARGKSPPAKDSGDSHKHHNRRRRSEKYERLEAGHKPRLSDVTQNPRSVKPVVRSERKIKLSQSGASSVLSDEKAQTLPRCKPSRRHRYVTKQPAESDSSDEELRKNTKERSKTDANSSLFSSDRSKKTSSLPRENEGRVSYENRSPRHAPHLRGARITKLKLSASEEPLDSIVDQTARLLSASEEVKYGTSSTFVIAEDVLHSLAQASDLLLGQTAGKEDRDRENRVKEKTRERDRDKDRVKENKERSVAKIKGHGRGRSHGPHKFHIPVVPRRHSFDDRILASSASKPAGRESSLTRESIGREAELEMKLAIVSNALMKEGEERQRIEADFKRVHKDNKRLQEDLRTASGQLRKFTEWFFRNVEQNNS